MMRVLICLCAATLLFGAGCSKTNDGAEQENPGRPADVAPPTETPPAEPGQMGEPGADTAMPPADTMPPDQPPPSESTPPTPPPEQ